MRTFLALGALLFLPAALPAQLQDEARLLRFPTIHGDRITFTYAGDLFTVPASGGVARKLTSHDGYEMFPRYSPDGKWLAFTGQYDGNTEVFLVPAEGGVPKRLTFTATLGRDDVADRMGPNNIVIGWKHDSKHIVFRSRMHEHNDFLGQLFTVSIEGGLPEQLPLPRGGFCSFSPDDSQLAYNRVFREFRTWKRYRGGMADDIWVYDFKTKQTTNITNTPEQDIIPMWHGRTIYYLSDRGPTQRMNLYAYNLDTRETRRLTNYADFDIKFPSLGDNAIVFELGGYLYRFDLATEKAAKVPVRILEDCVTGRGGIVNLARSVTNYEISPDGHRALFGARGEVFTVPVKHGPTRNLTNTSGVHERNSKWSPDGKWIAFVSDATGEDEIHVIAQDGKGGSKQVTSGGDTYKYQIYWSPDSKKILWADRKQRLQVVDLPSKQVTPVATATAGEIRDYTWSPDSKWVAYSRPEEEGMQKIYLHALDRHQSYEVTDGWYFAGDPAFSADGKYLFFVSSRDFNPTFGNTEFNHVYLDMARIYFVTLAKDTESPFKPQSDEVGAAEAKPQPPAKEAEKKDTGLKVDVEGLKDRLIALPVQSANYRDLVSVGNTLYYLRTGTKDPRPTLLLFDVGTQKESNLGPVDGFEISADKKKMLVNKDRVYGIVDLPRGPVSIGEPLNLSGMELKLDRHAEWNQIFHECWRQMRDFFYDPTMHGVDWAAMKRKYEPLLAHVNHRADLTYVIGEMISELNVGHAYVGGGEAPHPQRIPTGLLGAQLRRDPRTGYYQITKILAGANWDRSLRSPLTEPGVNVKVGDYIVAVEGKPTNEMANPYEALVNTADKQVTLKVNARPAAEGARDVVVIPTADEARLYYYNWVQGNIKKVSEATGGKVGYLHVPDMLTPGLNEFARYFYPQLRKHGFIIDVRGNGGGNVSPMLIERLRRHIALMGAARNSSPAPRPPSVFEGPMVCLINEFSASDGDLFPYQFRYFRLGKLIGKRTWGGVVGIRGTLPLVDGGYLNKPEFAHFDTEGKNWVIEGHGVEPDIFVDNDPAREYAGDDQQLNKAIEVILEELKTKDKPLPKAPAFPKKN